MQPPQDKGYQDPNMDNEDKRFPMDKGKKHSKDNLIDAEANLIYDDKHWKTLDKMNPDHVDKYLEGKAPTTEMGKSGICDGVLHLSGSFLEKHRDEIISTIKHSEELALERDPTNNIENIETSPDEITIYTAKNQLAVTLGKRLDSSFKGGKLDIKWSDDDKPVDVRWYREL